eukprot:6104965-Amphidinium_carterae.1
MQDIYVLIMSYVGLPWQQHVLPLSVVETNRITAHLNCLTPLRLTVLSLFRALGARVKNKQQQQQHNTNKSNKNNEDCVNIE